jgi:hypothetical protein
MNKRRVSILMVFTIKPHCRGSLIREDEKAKQADVRKNAHGDYIDDDLN